MIISEDEFREIKAGIAAFDEAATWKLTDAISGLDDEILENAITSLGPLTRDPASGTDLKIIPVPEKIRKNHLGDAPKQIISRSLCFSRQIGGFISRRNRTDMAFAESLRTYFCDLYMTLRHEGLLQDDLFLGMVSYIQNKMQDEISAAAATAVLVHLFLVCDVFEKSGEAGERNSRVEGE